MPGVHSTLPNFCRILGLIINFWNIFPEYIEKLVTPFILVPDVTSPHFTRFLYHTVPITQGPDSIENVLAWGLAWKRAWDSFLTLLHVVTTGWGGHLFRRFCKLFSDSSTVCWAILQLPCCPSKQGELLKNTLQNLWNKWPPHPAQIILIFFSAGNLKPKIQPFLKQKIQQTFVLLNRTPDERQHGAHDLLHPGPREVSGLGGDVYGRPELLLRQFVQRRQPSAALAGILLGGVHQEKWVIHKCTLRSVVKQVMFRNVPTGGYEFWGLVRLYNDIL